MMLSYVEKKLDVGNAEAYRMSKLEFNGIKFRYKSAISLAVAKFFEANADFDDNNYKTSLYSAQEFGQILRIPREITESEIVSECIYSVGIFNK